MNKEQFISEVVANSIEFSGYWAAFRSPTYLDRTDELGDRLYESVMVRDIEGPSFDDGDPRNGWIKLDHDTIEAAINKIVEGKVKVGTGYREWIAADWDRKEMDYFDAECADIVVQVAAFGEIVFS